jgi:hypothetical protein
MVVGSFQVHGGSIVIPPCSDESLFPPIPRNGKYMGAARTKGSRNLRECWCRSKDMLKNIARDYQVKAGIREGLLLQVLASEAILNLTWSDIREEVRRRVMRAFTGELLGSATTRRRLVNV